MVGGAGADTHCRGLLKRGLDYAGAAVGESGTFDASMGATADDLAAKGFGSEPRSGRAHQALVPERRDACGVRGGHARTGHVDQ